MSATLLDRLAAAAADYPTGDSVYVVAAYAFPHDLLGVFFVRDSAELAWSRDTLAYGVFGPFVTEGELALLFVPHCLGSIIPCYDIGSTPLPELPWLARDVDSIGVTVYHHSGDTWRSVSRGLQVDAVFFTLAAFDKFALPYYSALQGPARAAALRDSIVASLRTGAPR